MKLTPQQIADFDRDGYLFFPSLFTPREIAALTDEVPRLYAQRRPENARAMNVAIFLDEVNEFNGPLMFIPGSHKQGVVPASHDTSTTSYPLWTIDKDTITKLVAHGGIVAPKGPPGSMILFHGCLVHASTSNLSPW